MKYILWMVDPTDMEEGDVHPLPLDEMREIASRAITASCLEDILHWMVIGLNNESLNPELYYYVVEHGEFETLIYS